MFNIGAKLNWFGGQVKAKIDDTIDKGARNCGDKVVALAKQLAPKDTGSLAFSIKWKYDTASKTLQIIVRQPYGVYQEFGTYKMAPHPFIRPALEIAGPSFLAPFGVAVSMNTALPIGYIPRVILPHIRPKIAAAQKKHNRGKVSKTPFSFHHTGKPDAPVAAWAAHRDMSKLFTSKTDWGRESVSSRLKKKNFGVH